MDPSFSLVLEHNLSSDDNDDEHALLSSPSELEEYGDVPSGEEVRISHQNSYNISIKRLLVVAAIATIAGVNDYYPTFQPNLPQYPKIFTFMTTTLLCVGDFSGLLGTMLDWLSLKALQQKTDRLKQKLHYCSSLVLLDTLVGSASAVFAILASSSVFANSIDAGSPRVLATIMWLLHSLFLSYHLYLFVIKIQKKMVKYLVKIGPLCLISQDMRNKARLREMYADLIDRIEFKSSSEVFNLIRFLPFQQPPIFNARSIVEVTQYAQDILQKDLGETGRAKKERLIIKCVKYLLYAFMLWVGLVFAGTQMGSVHNALTDYVIPREFREFYQELSPVNQEHIISASIVTIFIQHLDSGLNAVDNLVLHVVRTGSELINWTDSYRALRHLAVLLIAGFLGALSFSFVYFSAQNGMDNINFKAKYETKLPEISSSIVTSTGGLQYCGINLSVPLVTSGFAILMNIASLISLFNRTKNYLLGGGRLLPLCGRKYSVPIFSDYDLLIKLELLSFLRAAYNAIDSRYYTAENSFEQPRVPIPQNMIDGSVLLRCYYSKSMDEKERDTESVDSCVADAPAQRPLGRNAFAIMGNDTESDDSSDDSSSDFFYRTQ